MPLIPYQRLSHHATHAKYTPVDSFSLEYDSHQLGSWGRFFRWKVSGNQLPIGGGEISHPRLKRCVKTEDMSHFLLHCEQAKPCYQSRGSQQSPKRCKFPDTNPLCWLISNGIKLWLENSNSDEQVDLSSYPIRFATRYWLQSCCKTMHCFVAVLRWCCPSYAVPTHLNSY